MTPTTIILIGAGATIGSMIAIPLIKIGGRVKRRKALNGDFGQLAKWKAELKDERPELVTTYEMLPKKDQIYIEAVAESKDEFVSETMNRVNEYLDGTEYDQITADELAEL